MAPLGYDPSRKNDDEGGGDFPARKPGRYDFKVDEASETVFSSGNKGLKLKFLVAHKEDHDATCYENLPYTDNMLWKLSDFLDSLGLDFENPPEAYELVGKHGVADFRVDEKGYFKVKKYLMPEPATPKRPAAKADEDNVPW
jgi:hypothetical protein